ncbi:MAG: type III toxin-antitoxin system ToxN/AbiQ family toxin [Clostridia bacterium]|nr:type III toxin-antitoxin system ToxN/AbiQ family toxin [Clostridia bacterium]
MIINLKIVRVSSDYCDYLRKFDNKVAYNKDEKELRPFVGILFKIEDKEYFAPLSSPKKKHEEMRNMLDFFKIKDGELGAVNFNNMIPVKEGYYEIIDLNTHCNNKSDKKYNKLLREQLTWLNENHTQVKNKSYKLYKLYLSNRLSDSVKSRCCNFKLLEEKCDEYKK